MGLCLPTESHRPDQHHASQQQNDKLIIEKMHRPCKIRLGSFEGSTLLKSRAKRGLSVTSSFISPTDHSGCSAGSRKGSYDHYATAVFRGTLSPHSGST